LRLLRAALRPLPLSVAVDLVVVGQRGCPAIGGLPRACGGGGGG
jgi:hypothetical protein